ncbi:slit homolog 1 protein-like [Mytilus trossulus]|uniref:slit homolog 1 protein-like n=1 Tax=Mytilus trossulus TaxID=6551 RepID=UPI003007843F
MSSLANGAFANLISLEVLYLQNNKITSIDANTFSVLTSILFLRLHENHISSIEPGAFKGLGLMRRLSLNDNNLTTVSANLFDSSTNLEQLRLQGNLLMCCAMIDLIEWAQNQTRLSQFNGTCHDSNIATDINSFNSSSCPVDGQWGPWSTASCSLSCGNGIGSRKRNCENPKPSVDGKDCVGPSMESMICNLGECQESCKESDKKSEWKKAK